MNAVIYARFSSSRQREESIEGQIRECTEYAERHGYTIVNTYIDRAKSAFKDVEKRVNFLRMIRDSNEHRFDVVLVWKLDRFSRDKDSSGLFKGLLRENGVKVVSVTEGILDGKEGIIMESLWEAMAQYYSLDLSEKVRRGHKENALKSHNNGGPTPFGYKVVDHKLVRDPITAPVVLEIFQRYADGETIQKIVDDLNNKGIKTSKGNKFTYPSFNTLLSNRTYIGEYHYDGTINPDSVPAIVPQDIFDKVQIRKAKNKHAPAAAKAKVKYLLTAKLFCGECGSMMVGESGKSKTGVVHNYYKCGAAKRKKTCKNKAVRKDWIEDIVVKHTMLMLMDDDLMERLAIRLVEVQGKESAKMKLLKKQLAEVTKGIKNMLNAIQAGIITPSTKERLSSLDEQKSQLTASIEQEEKEHPILTKEQIKFFLHRFRTIDIEEQDEKQLLIDCFINSVFVYDDKIILTFNYKDGEKTISLAELESSDLCGNGSPCKN